MSRRVSLFAVTVVVAGLAAQDAGLPRARVFGRAVAADGSAWQRAVVYLGSRPDNDSEASGTLDLLRVEVDAEGRFRADVSTGRRYVCWAIEERDGGAFVCSATAIVSARERVELKAGDAVLARRRVRIEGLEAWAHEQPVRVRLVRTRAACIVDELVPGADGWMTVPAVPAGGLVLEADGRSGVPLLPPSLQLESSGDPLVVDVAPPRPALIAVRDQTGKRPVAGAELLLLRRGVPIRLGVTEADGFAVVDSAFCHGRARGSQREPGELAELVTARAAGFELGALQARTAPAPEGVTLEERRARGDADAAVNLRPGVGLEARILLGVERPAAGMRLLVETTAWHQEDDSRASGRWVKVESRVGANGMVRFDGIESDGACAACLVLDDDHVRALPEPWRAELARTVPLVVPRAAGRRKTSLGDLDLTKFRAIDLWVSGPDGGPVGATRVRIGALDAIGRHREPLVTDRLGRLRVLVPPVSDLVVVAQHDEGYGFVRLFSDRVAVDPTAAPTRIDIGLDAPFVVHGKVTDWQAGDSGTVWAHPESRVAFGGFEPAERSDPDRRPPGPAIERIDDAETVGRVAQALMLSTSIGADGSYRLVLPAVAATFRIGGWTLRGQASRSLGGARFEFVGALDVQLDLVGGN